MFCNACAISGHDGKLAQHGRTDGELAERTWALLPQYPLFLNMDPNFRQRRRIRQLPSFVAHYFLTRGCV